MDRGILTLKELNTILEALPPAAAQLGRLVRSLATSLDSDRLIAVSSVHVSGISFDNLREPGLAWLEGLAEAGLKFSVPATINPAAFDPQEPPQWVDELEVSLQKRVIDALVAMGASPSLTCAPYFYGHTPSLGEHVAWAESSAVTFANSVLGARTNKESGPMAVAAGILGYTVLGGLHLDEHRRPEVAVRVELPLEDPVDWGALGTWIGRRVGNKIPYIYGEFGAPTPSHLQALAAALPTYGGPSMFHVEGVTPETEAYGRPCQEVTYSKADEYWVRRTFGQDFSGLPDLAYIGCPHPSLEEIEAIPASARFMVLIGGPKQCPHPLCYKGGCAAVARLPQGVNKIAVDSYKAAFYMRSKGYAVNVISRKRLTELASESVP